MNAGLKKELALLCGIGALATMRRKTPLSMLMGAVGGGLYLASLSKHSSVRGKSVLITGGSRGLGFALAQELLSKGARVTILARQHEELHRAHSLLRSEFPNGELQLLAADVTDASSLNKALQEAIENWNGLDIIINNAGAISVGPFASMERADFEAQMNLHLFAVIDATLAILPQFRKQGRGHIVNICSLGGRVAVPHMLPYDTSKFALAGFSQGLTSELKSENILVTTVYPTVMRTGSPIQAVFKGDHEKEFAWFASIDNMPGISLEASSAAQQIVESIENEDTELVPSVIAKARLTLGTLFPEIINAAMAFVTSLLPKGESFVRQTGAQSRRTFDRSLWSRGLSHREQESEKKFNQAPSQNPEYNMGIWPQ